jgi:hypothetical protein
MPTQHRTAEAQAQPTWVAIVIENVQGGAQVVVRVPLECQFKSRRCQKFDSVIKDHVEAEELKRY